MLQDMKPCMFWLEGLECRKHHLPVPTNQTTENMQPIYRHTRRPPCVQLHEFIHTIHILHIAIHIYIYMIIYITAHMMTY